MHPYAVMLQRERLQTVQVLCTVRAVIVFLGALCDEQRHRMAQRLYNLRV